VTSGEGLELLASANEVELEDVQSLPDDRGVPIDEVGISGLRLPVRIAGRGTADQPTVAELAMSVDLEASAKGTHMSRFVEVMAECLEPIDAIALGEIAFELRRRLQSNRASIAMEFPYFVYRAAPVTGRTAPVEYEGRLRAEAAETVSLTVGARVPIASLCPCSKEISDYGAHNQRGYVAIEVGCRVDAPIWIDDLIEIAEAAGSAPLYAVLKRPDERFVTMQAYENPAFVEDIARDVAVALRGDARVEWFQITVTNLESIHVHNAVATIRGRR
jgi:GTP cyclohydrolase I